MKVQETLEGDESKDTSTPLGCLLSFVVASLLFVPLWAGVNVAFGAALEGPIAVFLMEPPCQRLAHTSEPLSRYAVKGGWKRTAPSVCTFPSRTVAVTQSEGFTGREFVYLMSGLVGYFACFAGALVFTIYLVRGGQRFVEARLGRAKVQRGEPPPPKGSKAPRRSRSRRRSKR